MGDRERICRYSSSMSTGSDASALDRDGLTALSRRRQASFFIPRSDCGDPRCCEGGEKLGRNLGVLLREVLMRSGVRRAIVAGGDTSSHAVRQLGIEALTFAGTDIRRARRSAAAMPASTSWMDWSWC